MAANELTVIRADGATKTLRSEDLMAAGVHAQVVLVSEASEVPVNPSGGLSRHTVTSSPGATLDPPSAAARYARLRVYETVAPGTPTRRMYYRQDGTMPNANGTDAQGFLLHGEVMIVRLATFTNFKMIADNTDNGSFQVYVEWLNTPSS
jgi:hypothetical protein